MAGPARPRPSQLPTALPAEFRPAPALRVVAALVAALSLWAAVWALVRGIATGQPRLLIGAAVLALPCLVAATVLRRRVVVTPDALVSTGLLRTRRVAWSSIRHVDQTRHSFTAFAPGGVVSAGLIAADQRERLLRLVLEHGKLMAGGGPLRWGLRARYVPRAQPVAVVELQPHHRRKYRSE